MDMSLICLRDWSRSGGSYGNNTRVICCPAPGHPESAARGTSPPDNKSRLWRHASLLNDGSCSFTHPVVKDRSVRGTSTARKIVWPVNAGRVICRYQNNLSIIAINHIDTGAKTAGGMHCPLWRTRLHALSIVTHATYNKIPQCGYMEHGLKDIKREWD